MSVANCPSCGAAVEFAIGSSAVVVCNYCRSIVARTDRGVEDLGKVAAIIDTGSPLRVGLTGKYRGAGFRLTGRTQMRHEAGGVWDEWYAAFDDGRWGWLAEAQGKYYMTFKTKDRDAPPISALEIGAAVSQVDDFVVTEVGTAELAAAEGELPWRPRPGDRYEYADLSGRDGRFATIDYSEEQPLAFKGFETTLLDLGVAGEPVKRRRIEVTRLNCENCGGPLELRAPDQAERIYCPNCGAGHDVAEGRLKLFQVLKQKKITPVIPIGSKGKIDDVEYVVTGFLQRSVKFDRKYYWMEYLLFNQEKGFRWLVHSDEHWSFVVPIATGDVHDMSTKSSTARTVDFQHKTYKLFQIAQATVEYVLGEFYWKVEKGETVGAVDYIRPPEGLSKEMSGREVNWSHQRYMQLDEVEKAFGVSPSKPWEVGPLQPFPGQSIGGMWAMFIMVLIAAAILIAATRSSRVVFRDSVSPTQVETPPNSATQRPVATAFTQPFVLSGNQNLEIQAYSNISNSWVYVAGDLLNEDTGALESFELPVEFYEGYDGGEHWSEGSRKRNVFISSPPKGRYSMRLDVQWERADLGPVQVEVREGVFRWKHLLFAFIALSIPGLINLVRAWSFEVNRWKNSDYSPYGSAE